MSQYRDKLLLFVKNEMTGLKYDLNQSTTTLSLQKCCQTMFRLLQTLLYEVLSSQEGDAQSLPPAPPELAPVVLPTPVAAPRVASLRLNDGTSLPPLDEDPQTAAPQGAVQIPGLPPVEIVPGVKTVVVTANGTQVLNDPTAPTT